MSSLPILRHDIICKTTLNKRLFVIDINLAKIYAKLLLAGMALIIMSGCANPVMETQ